MNVSCQTELRLMGEVRQPRFADPDIVCRLPSFRAALRHAINRSGLDQDEVARALEVDAGEFSRMVRDPKHSGSRMRHLPAEKLGAFARVTGCLVAQQWIDAQVGMEPVAMRETAIQRKRRELAELEAAEAA